MRTRNFLNELLLVAAAAASLATLPVACGSYTSAGGSGGGSGSGSGGATSNGGATTNGGATSNGGATGNGGTTSNGGATGNGGTTSNGGATGNGGTTVAQSGGANSGGATGNGGATKADAAVAGGAGGGTSAGGTTGTGGSSTKADAATNGGATGTGGTTAGTGGTTAGTGGTTAVGVTLPCDVLNNATGNKCVSAHSTVRVIVPGYTGPLYQLCKGTANTGPSSCKGTPQDIGSKDGYADAAAQDTFCSGSTCTITKIYDQSGMKNDLEPAPQGGVCGPDKPADAKALPVTINGHSAYGVLIKPGIGYRAGCAGCTVKTGNGTAKGDDPESMYWVTSQNDLVDQCCFDYGNAETTSHDDGNGTMETLYFGGGVVWGTGYGGKPGPWVMADLENGLYAGWENKQDKNISTNKPLKYNFVTGVLLGDTKDKNSGKGRFAIYGGDATTGTLQTMYDGIRPEKPGYVPMLKQGSIILGIGGDNSCSAGGRFYEGAVSTGPVVSKEVVDALQAAIVAAKYEK